MLTLLALAAGYPARAVDPAVSGAPVLQVPLGSRALGMGSAFTAVASDPSALQYNPAGMARLNAHQIDLSYIAGAGESTLQHLAYAGPTTWTGISGNGHTAVAASLLLSQSGDIEINRLRADGSLQSSERLSAGRDLVAALGYAERVGMTSLNIGPDGYGLDHYLGVGGTFIHSTLLETYNANAAAGGAGYLLNCPEAGLSLGASALNLGGKLRYLEAADPLPASLRGGLAWQAGLAPGHYALAAVDGDYTLEEKTWHLNVGVEYFWLKTYGLRLGYQFRRPDQAALTAGLGLRWNNLVIVDYAWGMGDSFGGAHRFTVAYRFGGLPPSVRGRQRKPFIEASPERGAIKGLEDQRPAREDRRQPLTEPREHSRGVPGWIY